ncbi:unnamed protein product, partial [Brachionus calyciflorus]
MNFSSKERVIFIWSIPANGHMNPMLCFVNELIPRLDQINVNKIVFYTSESYKESIENIPNNKIQKRVEFRDYKLEKFTGSENLLKLLMDFNTKPGALFRVFKTYRNSVKLGAKYLFKNLTLDMHREKPILILYDQALFFGKIVLEFYSKKFKCSKPLSACYVTTFMCARGIYPLFSDLEKNGLFGLNLNLKKKLKNYITTTSDLVKYILTYYKTLWWDLDFTLFDLFLRCDLPLKKWQLADENLNIVFVLPEIQPRLEMFQAKQNINFVGPSVDENVRSNKSHDQNKIYKYTEEIELFLYKNGTKINSYPKIYFNQHSNRLLRSDSDGSNFKKYFKPIIYVSMGTVFQSENPNFLKILIKACQYFSYDYVVIVSTGNENVFDNFHLDLDNNLEDILLIPHTPQVEILKRAELFITHAGMNSISEAIIYGVPVICIPLSGDQPMVAWRVADELGMGIRLQPDKNLSVETVRKAISTMLTTPSYRNKAKELSTISKNYYGHRKACDLTIQFILKNEAKKALD